jgi:hypothetical protein
MKIIGNYGFDGEKIFWNSKGQWIEVESESLPFSSDGTKPSQSGIAMALKAEEMQDSIPEGSSPQGSPSMPIPENASMQDTVNDYKTRKYTNALRYDTPESSREPIDGNPMEPGDRIIAGADESNPCLLALLSKGRAYISNGEQGFFIDKQTGKAKIIASEIELIAQNIVWNGALPLKLNNQAWIPSTLAFPVPTFLLDLPQSVASLTGIREALEIIG